MIVAKDNFSSNGRLLKNKHRDIKKMVTQEKKTPKMREPKPKYKSIKKINWY